MGNIIPFTKPKAQAKVCTFCKRDESKVTSMIASQVSNACICGDCIKQAKVRLMENSNEEACMVVSGASDSSDGLR